MFFKMSFLHKSSPGSARPKWTACLTQLNPLRLWSVHHRPRPGISLLFAIHCRVAFLKDSRREANCAGAGQQSLLDTRRKGTDFVTLIWVSTHWGLVCLHFKKATILSDNTYQASRKRLRQSPLSPLTKSCRQEKQCLNCSNQASWN